MQKPRLEILKKFNQELLLLLFTGKKIVKDGDTSIG